jgi:hypothetical protein
MNSKRIYLGFSAYLWFILVEIHFKRDDTQVMGQAVIKQRRCMGKNGLKNRVYVSLFGHLKLKRPSHWSAQYGILGKNSYNKSANLLFLQM